MAILAGTMLSCACPLAAYAQAEAAEAGAQSKAAAKRRQDPAEAPSNHSPQFDVDESALDLGLRAMLQVSLDYLHAPQR